MEMLTRKGYDFFECSSAFQKSVRRGEEKLALFFAHELYCSGYSKYVWKRIMVITTEDIGLASPDLPTRIMSLYQMWEKIAEKCIEEANMTCIQAIITLCRSPKSRMIDEYKMFIFKSDYLPDVPDYALDIHTRRGKAMGRGLKFFLESGQKINNEVDTKTPDYIKEFYSKFMNDYDGKKVPMKGYDDRNVTHKNPKECNTWRLKNAQQSLFDH